MACREEGHELIDEVVVSEKVRAEGDGNDISVSIRAIASFFGRRSLCFHLRTLLLDDVHASSAKEGLRLVDLSITLDGQATEKPEWYKLAKEGQELGLTVGLENGLVKLEELI